MRRAQVADYERMIEEQAFKRKLMEQHLEQESSGKNSNALKKRVASTRECVLGQIAVCGWATVILAHLWAVPDSATLPPHSSRMTYLFAGTSRSCWTSMLLGLCLAPVRRKQVSLTLCWTRCAMVRLSLLLGGLCWLLMNEG